MQSEGKMFQTWMASRKAAGRVLQGTARWPHAGG